MVAFALRLGDGVNYLSWDATGGADVRFIADIELLMEEPNRSGLYSHVRICAILIQRRTIE